MKLVKKITHRYGPNLYSKIIDEETGKTVAVNVLEPYADVFVDAPETIEVLCELQRIADYDTYWYRGTYDKIAKILKGKPGVCRTCEGMGCPDCNTYKEEEENETE